MAGYRIVRINDDIKRELSELIPTLKDPRVRGLISITRVDTTPDLRYCKVYVSTFDKSDVKDMVRGLKSASGFLRRELAKRMTLRYTPELIFTPDDSIDQGNRIIGMLGKIQDAEPVGPSSDPAARLEDEGGEQE
jgi:ribosome-binding factor A